MANKYPELLAKRWAARVSSLLCWCDLGQLLCVSLNLYVFSFFHVIMYFLCAAIKTKKNGTIYNNNHSTGSIAWSSVGRLRIVC